MTSNSDHALGQRLAQLIKQSGDSAFEGGVLSRRLQAQLQDLLGAETSLLNPLRDLLQRPSFQQLFSMGSQGQLLQTRDALLRDLADIYSPTVLWRLDAVLQGCLNLHGAAAATWPTAAPPSTVRSTAPTGPAASWSSAPSGQPSPVTAAPPTVVTIPTNPQGPTSVLIALLALICGALVMALGGVLIGNRSNNSTASPPVATKPSSPPATTPPVAQPATEPPQTEPTAAAAGRWQACVDYGGNDGPPPQSGETWWPVVGPGEALEASRLHCRGDAFSNANGNVQVASFRDRDTAAAFAQQLTEDGSHPFSFWVGDPTQR